MDAKTYKISPTITAPLKEGVPIESLELLDSIDLLETKEGMSMYRFYRNENDCMNTLVKAVFDLTPEQLADLEQNPKKTYANVVFVGYRDFLDLLTA